MADEVHVPPFTYDAADYAALRLLTGRRLLKGLFRLIWVLVVLIILLLAVMILRGQHPDSRILVVFAISIVVATALQRHGSGLSGKIYIRIAAAQGLLREQSMTVAGDVFRASSSRGTTETYWRAIPRIEMTDDRLFVFLAKRIAYIIPRRAFVRPADFDAFVAASKARWAAGQIETRA